MHDETVKAERMPEIPIRIEVLAKELAQNEELIEQLESRLSRVLRGLEGPPLDRAVPSSNSALGEELAKCEERLEKNNQHLAMLLDRLEV